MRKPQFQSHNLEEEHFALKKKKTASTKSDTENKAKK